MILMSVVGFVLLVACGNLAGLALVRVGRRESEIATRLALGATKWAILRQFWMESLLLSIAGVYQPCWLAA
jgi:ABC-type antimicrobial peptide transport system permease subunit